MRRFAILDDFTIVMEQLNTRVIGDDFKGHPGYQGDDIDYCADIIRRVGSPRVKLLFDIYQVQIMPGDVISRIQQTSAAAHRKPLSDSGIC